MINIRRNVFETNSSSVHSITMCTESEYDKWSDGETFYYHSTYKLDKGQSRFFTFDEMCEFLAEKREWSSDDINELKELKENDNSEFEQVLSEADFYTYNSFDNYHDMYELYAQSYTTAGGETIVAFGYAGASY